MTADFDKGAAAEASGARPVTGLGLRHGAAAWGVGR